MLRLAPARPLVVGRRSFGPALMHGPQVVGMAPLGPHGGLATLTREERGGDEVGVVTVWRLGDGGGEELAEWRRARGLAAEGAAAGQLRVT